MRLLMGVSLLSFRLGTQSIPGDAAVKRNDPREAAASMANRPHRL
jgi:hypothetical protein